MSSKSDEKCANWIVGDLDSLNESKTAKEQWRKCFSNVDEINNLINTVYPLQLYRIWFTTVRYGDTVAIDLLLKSGKINPALGEDYAFSLAVKSGNRPAIDALWLHENTNPLSERAFEYAAQNGDIRTMSMLAQRLEDPTVQDMFPRLFLKAAEAGQTKMVEHLVSYEPSLLRSHGFEALRKATENGHTNLVSSMLKMNGLNVDGDDSVRLLEIDATKGFKTTSAALIGDSRVIPEANDDIALYLAAENGHFDYVNWSVPYFVFYKLTPFIGSCDTRM